MSNKRTLPTVHFIEAKIGTSIIARATGPLPNIPVPIGLIYTLVFDEGPDFPGMVKVISAAFDKAGVEVDFEVSGNGPLLMVEPSVEQGLYKGLSILQELFKPRIPHAAIVFEQEKSEYWKIQMTILGGYLSQDRIDELTATINATGARVTGVNMSIEQEGNVFFITVAAHNNRQRRGFLNKLQQSCGIFATIQDAY